MSTDQESPPIKNETTSKDSSLTNKPETDDAKTLIQDSDPNVKEIPPLKTETSSNKDALSQTNNPKTEDADPRKTDETPSGNEVSPENTSPTKNDPTQTKATSEQQTEAIKQNSEAAADPHVQEITPIENKPSSPSNNSSTPITTKETDDTESHRNEPATVTQDVTPVESKDSSPPNYTPSEITTTHQPETEEISPAHQDKTTSSPSKTTDHRRTQALASSKKTSLWDKLNCFINRDKSSQLKASKGTQDKTSGAEKGGETGTGDDKVSKLIEADIAYIKKGEINLEKYNLELKSSLKQASNDFAELKAQNWPDKKFLEMRKAMIKLKLQIPSKYEEDDDEKYHKKFGFSSIAKQSTSQEMPQLHKNHIFESSMDFKNFEARYKELSDELKRCLLCFSAFPENAIIKKRLMVQWWVTEGFASEEVASKYFLQLIRKGFIEPVNDKENKSLFVGSCRMPPFYRSALVMLAERAKFFNFDGKGEPRENIKGTFQGCLVGKGLISYKDLQDQKVNINELDKYLDEIHLLLNVNEPILEFKLNWFNKMRNVNILYLGRWKASATDHREVEDTKFLDGLVEMKYVKFLSLQGVSNIITLPESILQLAHLKILDLRACHNLETIPEGIGLLKSLTHLDMSECYLLQHMPKGLSLLTELMVLKGFVVGGDRGRKSCKLDDLKPLKKLIKLCIYTGLRKFPDEEHVKALENLEDLTKLTITWGGRSLEETTDKSSDNNGKHINGNKKKKSTKVKTTQKEKEPQGSSSTLPSKLEKLDLKCFPISKTPHCLRPSNLTQLKNLKKLYVRGGKLSDLGQYQDVDDSNVHSGEKNTWTVKVLRLKYLSEIEMEWRQLQELFPDLGYLEQVSCPKLNLFPCDTNGIWMNETKLKEFRGVVP